MPDPRAPTAPNTVVVLPRPAPLDRASLWYLFTALGLILGYLAHDLVATPAEAIAPEPARVVREVPAAPPTAPPAATATRPPERGAPGNVVMPTVTTGVDFCDALTPTPGAVCRQPYSSPTATPTLVACADARPGALCQVRATPSADPDEPTATP